MNVFRRLQRHICCVFVIVLLVGQPVSAGAQTVLIDFGSDTSFRGLSVNNPDDNGNYWNSLQPGLFYTDLIDIDNNATTIDLGFDTPVGTDSYNGPAGPTDASTLETDVQFTDIDAAALGNLGGALEAAFDFAAGPSLADNRVRFQIQELDPTKTYTLTFFGSHIFSNDTTTVYSIYTDNTYSTLVDTASLDVQVPGSPNVPNRDQVATISGISAQADNILYVEFVGSTGNLGYLNAMQIESSASTLLAGDYNENGTVDAADYTVWRDNLGSSDPLPNDPNDGPVDLDQYNTWRANFGLPASGSSGLAASSAVPEPASLIIAMAAAIGLFSLNRRS